MKTMELVIASILCGINGGIIGILLAKEHIQRRKTKLILSILSFVIICGLHLLYVFNT